MGQRRSKLDHDDEIIKLLRKSLNEYRALLNAAAAIIIKNQAHQENQRWLELAEKYGVVDVYRNKDRQSRD